MLPQCEKTDSWASTAPSALASAFTAPTCEGSVACWAAVTTALVRATKRPRKSTWTSTALDHIMPSVTVRQSASMLKDKIDSRSSGAKVTAGLLAMLTQRMNAALIFSRLALVSPRSFAIN
eukprot:4002781-Pyramimonas_sp.AAC.1